MSDGWRFTLARSSDRSTVGVLRNAHDRTLNYDLNKSGSSGLWLPTSDRNSAKVTPWKTCLIAQFDDQILWSGPVVSRVTSMKAGRVSVSAVDWFERLMKILVLEESLPYTALDAGAIVVNLLTKALAQDPTLPITIGDVQITQPRTITYLRDQSIGQAIIDLANFEAGFDWYIDPISLKLNIVAHRGVDRPNVKWTFIGDGRSQHSNLDDCEETVDGSLAIMVNELRARGKFSSDVEIDGASQAAYGLFSEAASLSDVVEPAILAVFAVGELVYRSNPRLTYKLTPKSSAKASVPRLGRHFNIGDTTYLTARRDFINIVDLPTRAFGASLAIADSGTEQITDLRTVAA